MSLSDIASFGKKLLFLSERVDKNAEEIETLRQDLKTLTDFTQKVAYAVRRNESRAEDRSTIVMQKIENELLKLENRLLTVNQPYRLGEDKQPNPPIEPEQ